jgi:hypothetical protein
MPGENTQEQAQEAIEAVMPDGSDAADAPTGLEELAANTRQPRATVEALAADRRKAEAAQRQKDREQGRMTFQSALDKRAQALGFGSVEEMLAETQPRPKKEPTPQQNNVASAALQEETARLRDENKTLQHQIRGLRSRISSLETELELRHTAYESDINPDDVDYALSQVNSHYKRLPEEQAKTFDPKKFLAEELRTRKPGIFRQAMAERKVEEVPITTALPGNAPRPPAPAETRGSSESPPKRATEMTRAEYVEAMRKRGITDPATKVH